MESKHIFLKDKALMMRREGYSIRGIENELKIPRSTLSGWFRGITLTEKQKRVLRNNWMKALSKARKGAVSWHRKQKEIRIQNATSEATSFLKGIDIKDKRILEIAVAFLYLGEGSKKGTMALGSSNIEILRFYIFCLDRLYKIKRNTLRFDLHLRYDQDVEESKQYWSKGLDISIDQIKYCAVDFRTKNRKTFEHYRGVCIVSKGNIIAHRRLLEIARIYSSMVRTAGD